MKMKWWQFKKREADLERELGSDLELEEEEQREGRHFKRRGSPRSLAPIFTKRDPLPAVTELPGSQPTLVIEPDLSLLGSKLASLPDRSTRTRNEVPRWTLLGYLFPSPGNPLLRSQ